MAKRRVPFKKHLAHPGYKIAADVLAEGKGLDTLKNRLKEAGQPASKDFLMRATTSVSVLQEVVQRLYDRGVTWAKLDEQSRHVLMRSMVGFDHEGNPIAELTPSHALQASKIVRDELSRSDKAAAEQAQLEDDALHRTREQLATRIIEGIAERVEPDAGS